MWAEWKTSSKSTGLAWWYMPFCSALWMQRQVDFSKYKGSLMYMISFRLARVT